MNLLFHSQSIKMTTPQLGQDRLKSWLRIVKKKTARLSTRITASLGLITLTKDEEFERHLEQFKHLEKTIKTFIKNLNVFVDHLESFLLSLQNASDHLSDFYRDKSHYKELMELKQRNKALACEHFHAFKRTIDRHVVSVATQLLQKFSGPHQVINKRAVKLLDFDTKAKAVESCKDETKKTALQQQYVIAKELYDQLNKQLIRELPLFNQFALQIFRECVLVLLDCRKNLIASFTKQTANLLDTPLMASYTASDVASNILMSCDEIQRREVVTPPPIVHQARYANVASDDGPRSGSACSQLSSEFNHMALAAREISSTPLSHVSGDDKREEYCEVDNRDGVNIHYDYPDAATTNVERVNVTGTADNQFNENIELRGGVDEKDGCSEPAPVGKHVDASLQSVGGAGEQHSVRSKASSKKKKRKVQWCVASWPFVATGPPQLTISKNQVLKLIKTSDESGNSDWSYVKDKHGHCGYVPSSYITRRE